MVRRAASVLSRRRWAELAALTAVLGAYTAGAGLLWDAGLWPDVLFLSFVVFPATCGVLWLLLPLWNERGLLFPGLGLVGLAVLFRLAELDVLFNLAKLYAFVLLGFWFLSYFETVAWAVIVAAIVPWVDAISVWRGPTEYVVSERPDVFENLSIAFRVPGESGGANLGPPDIVFFALFLGAAVRWGLRPGWTWIVTTLLLGGTLLLTVTTLLLGGTLLLTATTDVAGLPALPAVCVGFLLPNADLLWRQLRGGRSAEPEPEPEPEAK